MKAKEIAEKSKQILSDAAKLAVTFPDFITKWDEESNSCYDGIYEDDEQFVLRNFNQKQNPHVIVVGSRNALKDFSSKIFQDIRDKKVKNKELIGYSIFILDGQKFYDSLTEDHNDVMEKLARKLKRFGKTLLYIKNFEFFIEHKLIDALIPLLYGDIRIIAPIEVTQYTEKIFDNIVISKAFYLFALFPFKSEEFKKYLAPSIYELEKHHGVKYSDEAIEKGMLLANAFCSISVGMLGEAYSDLDFAASIAKEKGRSVIEAEDVMDVLKPLYKVYGSIDDDNKYRTAIHEAGHYAVFLSTKHLTAMEMKAITILPTQSSLGFNIADQNPYNVNHDIDYVRDVMDYNLGGWAAEKVFFGKPSRRSSQDIETAVSMAYDSIVYDVLGSDETKNTSAVIAFMNENSEYVTDYEKSDINKNMDKEVANSKGRDIAIIKLRQNFVKKVADELLIYHILSAEQLKVSKDKYYDS